MFSAPILLALSLAALTIYALAWSCAGVLVARLVPALRARYRQTRILTPIVLCATMWLLLDWLEFIFMWGTVLLIPFSIVGLLLTRHLVPTTKKWAATAPLDHQFIPPK